MRDRVKWRGGERDISEPTGWEQVSESVFSLRDVLEPPAPLPLEGSLIAAPGEGAGLH